MKILFMISSLNSGGAERVLVTLANFLSLNNDIIILKTDDKESFYEISPQVCLESLNLNRKNKNIAKKFLHNFYIIFSMRKRIKKYNPDIIISFMDRTNIYTILATRFLNKKIIISERINYNYLKSILWRFLREIIYPLTDGMVVLSKYDYDKYKRVKNKKIIFNPLFIGYDDKEEKDKEKIILSVGRLVRDKGFDVLLNSLALVDQKILKDWQVYIIGDGDQRMNLEIMVKKLNLESTVYFLGKKKNIAEYYRKASIFISTSRAEGFPNALSEALSFGCSTIATNCLTGPAELIKDKKNGFLVEVDNIDDIKKSIEILVQDKKLRDKFSKNSIELSKKFRIDKIIKAWEEYINETINRKN